MPLLLLMILIMPFETNPYLHLFDEFLVFQDITVIKLVGLVGFAWALLHITNGQASGALFDTPQARYFLLFFGGILFAGALSGSGLLPISRFLAFLVFLPFVLVAVRNQDDLRRVMFVVALAYVLVLPYAVRQMMRYGGRLGTGIYETNYFAANLVLIIPIAFAVASAHPDAWRRRLWAGAGALLVIALLLTASRGGLLGLMAAASFYTYRRRGLAMTMVLLGTILGAALILPTGLAERALATLGWAEAPPGLEASNQAHVALFWAGLRMIADAPLTGVGPHNFKALSMAYAPDLGRAYIAHNTYLELGAELGLPVLGLFLLIIAFVFRTLGRATRLHGSPEARELATWAEGLRSGLIGFLVAGAFISAQYEKLFWLAVFLSIVIHRALPAHEHAAPASEPEPVFAPASAPWGRA